MSEPSAVARDHREVLLAVAVASAPHEPALAQYFLACALATRPAWDDLAMITAVPVDLEAIARACEAYGVERLRIFGSVLGDDFDRATSDVDFLVDFLPGRGALFHDYFELKQELERIVGRGVDLVDAGAVRNPYFARSAFGSAEDVYAA